MLLQIIHQELLSTTTKLLQSYIGKRKQKKIEKLVEANFDIVFHTGDLEINLFLMANKKQ